MHYALGAFPMLCVCAQAVRVIKGEIGRAPLMPRHAPDTKDRTCAMGVYAPRVHAMCVVLHGGGGARQAQVLQALVTAVWFVGGPKLGSMFGCRPGSRPSWCRGRRIETSLSRHHYRSPCPACCTRCPPRGRPDRHGERETKTFLSAPRRPAPAGSRNDSGREGLGGWGAEPGESGGRGSGRAVGARSAVVAARRITG